MVKNNYVQISLLLQIINDIIYETENTDFSDLCVHICTTA